MNRPYSLQNDFPMSSKIYIEDLCSFTIIQPGKKKDDYWCNDDMCRHLKEVALICKWVHRRLELRANMQPELVFIFDGSSNHGAKPPDALHVGQGINRDPGGKNDPGSRPSLKNSEL